MDHVNIKRRMHQRTSQQSFVCWWLSFWPCSSWTF